MSVNHRAEVDLERVLYQLGQDMRRIVETLTQANREQAERLEELENKLDEAMLDAEAEAANLREVLYHTELELERARQHTLPVGIR